MNGKRIGYHLLFWLVYIVINLYNELYLSKSFILDPTWSLFLQSMTTIFILLVPKIVVVYFLLYVLIPKWLTDRDHYLLVFSAGGTLLLGALAIRMLIQSVVWPHIYKEAPPEMTNFSLLARYFYSLLDLSQVACAAMSIKLYKLQLASIQQEKALQLSKSKAELLNLKAQTNPHFLFNTLNSIYALARLKSEQTADSILRLSKILRFTIYDSDKEVIQIQDEIKIIKDYIALQDQRFGDRIQVQLRIQLDNDSALITPLMLLPLVENVYKHHNGDNSIVPFDIKLLNQVLSIETSNAANDEVQDNSGTGLLNLRKQLQLLYKDFSLIYGSASGYFQLKLIIHLNTYTGNELFNS